jgi:hypothetical protein
MQFDGFVNTEQSSGVGYLNSSLFSSRPHQGARPDLIRHLAAVLVV